ncbi:hypothetical protein DYB28_007817 [Aphanomyces astaci]|uniref:Uncharacterized protein n=2 Tax=Aphanomyces astaci TaxID=112090 RepID=A0A9X8EC81_APHAT|nr:hypothetical protein DYB28_007817 [Aphanomyces astaci]
MGNGKYYCPCWEIYYPHNDMAATTSTILQAILFVSPQFYCYPWKPLLNAAIGDTYDVALKHFLVNHKTAPNLVLHCVCMVVQLLGNFCFLQTVDDILFPSRPRPLSILTAVTWIVYLLRRAPSAPWWVQLASASSIAAAAAVAPSLVPHGEFVSLVLLATFLGVLLLVHAIGFHKSLHTVASVLSTLVLVGFHVLWSALPHHLASISDHTVLINCVFLSLMLLISLVKNPLVPSVAYGYLVGHALAAITGQAWLFFFSFGFFGSVLQSVSHLVTKEVPTMVALQTVASPADKVRYEYAHVTFFPHLVFHGLVFSSDLVNKSSKTT